MAVSHFNRDLEFDDLNHEALMGVWWTGVLLKKQARRFFRDTLASEAQFNIMLLLKYAEVPLTQNELSSRLLVDKSNVTGLVNRMAAAGLLRRVQVPDDRRAYHLKLTPAGLKLLNHAGLFQRGNADAEPSDAAFAEIIGGKRGRSWVNSGSKCLNRMRNFRRCGS